MTNSRFMRDDDFPPTHTPKGLHIVAQGKRSTESASAALGYGAATNLYPAGVASTWMPGRCNPFGVNLRYLRLTHGGAALALGFAMQRLWRNYFALTSSLLAQLERTRSGQHLSWLVQQRLKGGE
jgi:hypothetical protein